MLESEGFKEGEKVLFTPSRRGALRPAQVIETDLCLVQLEGDPFPVTVKKSQLSACKDSETAVSSTKSARKSRAKTQKEVPEKMPTDTAELPKEAKALRKMAQAAGVVGWEKLDRKGLAKAIEAKQSSNGDGKSPKADETEVTEDTADVPKVKKEKKSKSKKGKEKVSESPKGKKKDKKVKAAKKVKRGETKADKGEPVTPTEKAKPVKASKGKAKSKTVTKTAKTAKTSTATKTGDGITLPKGSTPYQPTGENPFRRSSNMFLIAKLLLRGGKRSVLAEKLAAQVELHPYKGGETKIADHDKRLLLGAQTMRDQHGYGIHRTGRGIEGTIKVFVPGGAGDPRNSVNGKSKVAGSKKPAKVS